MVKAFYRNPTFVVKIDGATSDKHTQHTGIRQGCPLSPYLFLLAMTAMFHDIKQEIAYQTPVKHHPCLNEVQNANFNELLYADECG
jgi:hypothetical protein